LDKAIGLFSDERLARLSREIFSQLAKNDQKVKIESTAERIIRKSKEYARSALLAARYWIDSCTQSNPDQLPERLGFLIDNNIPADRVCMFYEDKFYNLSKNSSAMRKMCDFGRKLIAKCTSDTNTVNNITLRILDGAFIVGDYASAIEMIEKGVPGKDKSWHELTLPKVKAHWAMDRAMKEKDEEKRKDEFDQAASYFRDFMNVWLKSDKQEEVDPVSGICYSKEWILGYNAGRIGKIYLQIGKGDEAIKAFNEARDYYRKALKIAENDEEALKILKPEAAAFGVK
jgi:tetratricopeptide (TPR) repeat protein